VPEQVSVALGELVGEVREGLLALAVGTGLQVWTAMMEADVIAVCGPKGRHDPARTATRHGHEARSVSLGGRRVAVERPRMRATNGSGELPIPTYELFSGTEARRAPRSPQNHIPGEDNPATPDAEQPDNARLSWSAS
jgi:putative transposase